ncbi:GTP 3',8-cyclase [Desulfosarcina widdelii]|uniref:GTP 3',8-cyclase n=1 Tax=Desulfosarcina widdelii TaxID=947919 RepID=A0A5K7Z8B0_9BACT|nr:GTP 3',8-cyclase MoaA [Desulfosarcina widdelii]BBO74704.1 GTP 3',8-cyclase [Desulfosarcina widdelii]
MSRQVLTDRYQRQLSYLRVSVTDRCNLRCIYCVPGTPVPRLKHEDILRYEEILRVMRVGIGLGINKVRVTGGEPLVRKGITGFLEKLAVMEGLRDVSLTTNGVRLAEQVHEIRKAGIQRINVSLDTLNPATFMRITRRDRFRKVWAGIMAAHRAGFDPIKINAVVLGGINDSEVVDLARLTFDYPFHVRFIEYMPVGNVGPDYSRRIFRDEILERIYRLGTLTPVSRKPLDGPAERYRLAGAQGEIGIIGAISHNFCSQCNRLRLTARGRLRTCLLSDEEIDLIGPLRKGCTDRDLEEIFIQAARRKQERHHLSNTLTDKVSDRMSAIGG